MFFKSRRTGVEWMVVGLGNPGKKYEHTRHNVGFDALDYAAREWDIPLRRFRFDALTGQGNVGGRQVLLVKPQIYMNLSGVSVQKAADYFKLPPERVLVLTDDISLPPGALRIRKNGSAGGHNGLKSIIGFVGDAFPRVRIGIGEKPHPEYDLADWVTGRFSAADAKAVEARYPDIAAAVLLVLRERWDEAMGLYNGAGKPGR